MTVVEAILYLCASLLLLSSRYGVLDNVLRNFKENSVTYSPPFKFPSSTPTITLLAESLSPSDRVLRASLIVYLPMGAQCRLVDAKTHEPIANCTPDGNHGLIKNKLLSKTLTVYIQLLDEKRKSILYLKKNFKLADFNLDNSITNEAVAPLEIPVDGFPEFYPNDYYNVDVGVHLDIPGIDLYNYNSQKSLNRMDTYGQSVNFSAGVLSEQYEVYAKHPPCTTTRVVRGLKLPGVCFPTTYFISFQRQTRSMVYVYVRALVPLLLALVIFHMSFFRRRSEQMQLQEFFVAIAAASLAVLPLRVVLVPSDIAGLTRVDFVLGFGLASTVSVAIGRYARELHRADSSERPACEESVGEAEPSGS